MYTRALIKSGLKTGMIAESSMLDVVAQKDTLYVLHFHHR